METETLDLAFAVDDPQLDAATFDVICFEGEEHISKPFYFVIKLVSYEPHLTLAGLADKPATLTVVREGEPRTFHGIVIDFEQGPHVADRFTYTATLVPRLWLLSLRFQSRTFLQKNVPDIVEDVLRDAGFQGSQYRFDVTGADYPAREYCVQYQETDLAFISRLLEHEGIHYYFEKEIIVFRDESRGRPPAIPGGGVLVYNPGGGLQASAEAVREFTCHERMVPGMVVLRDYNYRTTDATQQPMETEAQGHGDAPGLRYEYGEHFPDQAQGDRLARVRREEIEAQQRVMWGKSGYVRLRAGHRFTLKGHFRDLDGEYRLVSVVHLGTQGASVPGLMQAEARDEASYLNTFMCLPASVTYRPVRQTPVPKIPGLMTGRIETAAGNYAYLDDQGRYRLRTWYDRGTAPEAEASHWVRMKQAYSGSDYGIHFPNHAETEVVLAFLDGDPNRPLALGTVPHPQQTSPVTAANNTQNLIRTYAGNEMLMEDLEDATKIALTSAGNHQAVLDDGGRHIGLTTSGGHRLRMDDAEHHIQMASEGNHVLRLDDQNRYVWLASTNGHILLLNDADGEVVLRTKEGHVLGMDDPEKFVGLRTAGGQRFLASDADHVIILHSTSEQMLRLHDQEGITLESPDNRVHIRAATEIKLQVGDNTITISQTGIAINGTDLTEITGTLVTIN